MHRAALEHMAIYHLSLKPISRGSGRSATAASAYRSATRIRDEATGEVFDYTRKRGVEHSEIILPSEKDPSVAWARDRERLWNAAERAERRKDARVAREYEVALPDELKPPERLALTRSFAQELADRYRCAVDFAIHRPHREGDVRNHHAHILVTTRAVDGKGLGAKTTIELSDTDRSRLGLKPARAEVTEIRERWKELTNIQLRASGHETRVDHRSLEAQGVDRSPTPHLGPVVMERLRRGKDSEVLERIRDERREEAALRLATAAERGQLEASPRASAVQSSTLKPPCGPRSPNATNHGTVNVLHGHPR
jgi:ATP-dependent exoDNAse (exonuclease V) alpha subunit